MQPPFQLQVFASHQSQTQDVAAWTYVLGAAGAQAQPLTAWLLLAISKFGTKRTLSNELSKHLAITHKTFESGLPKMPAKFQRSMAHFTRFLLRSESELSPESIACRRRAFARMENKIAEHPDVLPCVFFHASIGHLGDQMFEQLAVAIDDLSTEILTDDLTMPDVAQRIVLSAERVGATRQDEVSIRPDLDPGLDATLLLLARLDLNIASHLMIHDDEIVSIFALLLDMSDTVRGQSARRRLLDLFYGLARAASGRALPNNLPTIYELEDTLMGGPHEDGTQSWMIRWRGGNKLLRLKDIEDMGKFVSAKAKLDIQPLFRHLYLVALFFELVEQADDAARLTVGLRYREWWNSMETSVREKVSGVNPFFSHFHPHA